MPLRAIILIVSAMLMLIAAARGDELNLPGSTVKIEDANSKADTVFIGKFTDLGPTTPTSPDMASFTNAKIDIQKCFRGSVQNKVTAEFSIFGINREILPVVGTSYLFYASKGAHRLEILKMELPTVENIAAVRGH